MKESFEMQNDEQKKEMATIVSNLTAQADRAVVTTDEQMETAGDLVKLLVGRRKKIELERTSFVKPLNDTVGKINKEFKKGTGPIDDALVKVRALMGTYMAAKEKEARLAREAAIKEAEDKALAEAEERQKIADEEARQQREAAEKVASEARAAGDEEGALNALQAGEDAANNVLAQEEQRTEEVLQGAADAANVEKHTGSGPQFHGNYGASTHATRIRKWKIKNLHDIPVRFLMLDEAEIKKALREAKTVVDNLAEEKGLKGKTRDAFIKSEMEAFEINGLEFYFETGIAVR